MSLSDESKICLENCGSWCCKHTLKIVTDTEKEFYEFCGFDVRILTDGRYLMVCDAVCQYLKDDKCSIYGTGKRHEVCRRYPNSYHEIFAPYCKLMREKYSRRD